MAFVTAQRGISPTMLARIALLAVVAGLFLTLYLNGFFSFISDGERVRASVEAAGLWAPAIYVVAFSLLEPFFVPGLVFIIPGALVWSYPQLLLLSWLGSIGAGIVGFSFARFVGRDYVAERLPQRLRRFDDRLASRGLRTVILVRLTLFLAPPAHWLLGLSQVRFGPFVLGTAIGFIPGIALLTYLLVFFGQTFGDFFTSQPRGSWLAVGIVVVVIVRVRRKLRERRERREAAEAQVGGSPPDPNAP